MKRASQLLFLVLLFVLMLAAIYIFSNYPIRVSLLRYATNATGNCGKISSDGKWLACIDREAPPNSLSKVVLYSTDIPFRKVRITLPTLSTIRKDAGIDEDADRLFWSPVGANLVVPITNGHGDPLSEFMIVQVSADGSTVVSEYYDPENEFAGHVAWSTDGKRLIVSYIAEENQVQITLIDQFADIESRFTFGGTLTPSESEEISDISTLFAGENIYAAVNFRDKYEPNQVMIDPQRTEVYKVSTVEPHTVNHLVQLEGEFNLYSISPDTQQLIISEQINRRSPALALRMVSTNGGGLLKEIPITLDGQQIYFTFSYGCLGNGGKAYFIIKADNANSPFLLVWSWETKDFRTYPGIDSIVGSIEPLNGFLCSRRVSKSIPVMLIGVCD